MDAREVLKTLANGAASLVMTPAVLSFRLRAACLGRDRALEGSTQAMAILPGLLGQYLRRAFLRQALEYCDPTATIEFGAVFSQSAARLEAGAYIGPRCHIGLAHIGRDVLVAAGVHVPSGGASHDFSDLRIPIRHQPNHRSIVRLGDGCWIGSGSVVMADVGADTVVGAGSVVAKPLPPRAVAAGVPAKVIRFRTDDTAATA